MSTTVLKRSIGARWRTSIFGVALLTAAAVSLWALSFPGLPFSWAGLGLLLWGAALVVGLSSPASNRRLFGRIAPVLALLTTVGLVVGLATAVPLMPTRFEAGRAEFDALVSRAGPLDPAFLGTPIFAADPPPGEPEYERGPFGPFPVQCPARLGGYNIADCHTFADGYLFLLQEAAVTDEAGFAYLPHGLPRRTVHGAGLGPSGFTHLQGAWYSWVCNC